MNFFWATELIDALVKPTVPTKRGNALCSLDL